MIPLKIQNVQIGALSADKAFQSQKNLPQNAQRIFEAEVKKHMDEEEKKHSADKEKAQKKDKYLIEKAPNGTIKHLDVKI
jgi:hypothetical protein